MPHSALEARSYIHVARELTLLVIGYPAYIVIILIHPCYHANVTFEQYNHLIALSSFSVPYYYCCCCHHSLRLKTARHLTQSLHVVFCKVLLVVYYTKYP